MDAINKLPNIPQLLKELHSNELNQSLFPYYHLSID